MKCRHCNHEINQIFMDLGSAPPSNAYLSADKLDHPEKWFPLRVFVCDQCWLVQTEDFAAFDELFDENYAYFSSFSSSWLKHSERYSKKVIERFDLNAGSYVVEVASNDGYLLQYFKEAGISCAGIEPTASTAKASRNKGIETIESFFGEALGKELANNGKAADLTAANNVLAHVPDINDFVKGFASILKPAGVSTFEFPSLLNLIRDTQFDTIYHEHFSYLSLTAVANIFETNGLSVFDVEQLPTHGGSLRVYAQRNDTGSRPILPAVTDQLQAEETYGLKSMEPYQNFELRANIAKDQFLSFLINAKTKGKSVVGYGAAAKGNTFINYAGVRRDFIKFVVDKNPAKQGQYLPGCRIPISNEERLKAEKPDYIVILPWNLREEICEQLDYAREWGALFVTAIPSIKIH